MNKRIIYTRADGGCSVVTPAPNGKRDGEDDDAFLARLIAGLPADAKDVRVIDANEVPTDRTFRNAWRNNGAGKPEVDMPAARELWRERMRRARAPKLAALDVEYQRADEAADAGRKADVVKRKQTLRDVTDDPRIEAAQTPDELKAVWPAELD